MNQPEDLFFSELLKQFRKRKKLNQKQLAERIEVSRETVSLWERGEYKPEADRLLYKIVEVLGLTAQQQQQLFKAYTVTALATSFYNPPFERNPYFTGRNPQLTNLHALLTKGKQVALTQAISGLGGIGKTQLALEYAYRYQKSYHDIFWAAADTYDSLMSSYVQLATLLHLPEHNEQDQNKVKIAVQQWLGIHRGWLLILDNIEDLNLVHQFIPKDRQGAVLLTTRRQVTEPIAQALELEVLPKNDAVLFLLKRARVLTIDMSLGDASDHDIEAARAITQLLGNLPLALDQAGAYISEAKCGLTGYQSLYLMRRAEMLKERGNLVDDDPEPDYPETVATTWSISFQKVEQKNPAAAELLRFCAFLAPDAIPEEIITASAEHLGSLLQTTARDPMTLNKAIAALGAYSPIRRDATEKTLSIHRLVQAVLIDTMDEQNLRQWTGRTVLAMNAIFPTIDGVKRQLAQRYILHAQACAKLIDQWNIKHAEAARLLHETGSYCFMVAQYEQAEPLLKHGLEIREHMPGSEYTSVGASLNNLALLYQAQGKHEQAKPLLMRALKIIKQAEGPEGSHVSAALTNLAEAYKVEQNYRQAESLLLRAWDIDVRRFGQKHREVAIDLNNLAELYRTQGKYEQAESFCLKALAIREEMLEPKDPHTISSYNNLALIFHKQGKYQPAESLYQRILTIFEEAYGSEHPDLATSFVNLALLYEDWRKNEEAKQLYQRALVIYERMLGSEHPNTKGVRKNYISLLRAMGCDDEAKQIEEKQ